MKDQYIGLSEDYFRAVQDRYKNFQECLNDVTTAPVKVFNPLAKKNIAELELIREVSKKLQAKKEEDIKKAAQAAAAPEVEKAEDKTEVVKEDKAEDVKQG